MGTSLENEIFFLRVRVQECYMSGEPMGNAVEILAGFEKPQSCPSFQDVGVFVAGGGADGLSCVPSSMEKLSAGERWEGLFSCGFEGGECWGYGLGETEVSGLFSPLLYIEMRSSEDLPYHIGRLVAKEVMERIEDDLIGRKPSLLLENDSGHGFLVTEMEKVVCSMERSLLAKKTQTSPLPKNMTGL